MDIESLVNTQERTRPSIPSDHSGDRILIPRLLLQVLHSGEKVYGLRDAGLSESCGFMLANFEWGSRDFHVRFIQSMGQGTIYGLALHDEQLRLVPDYQLRAEERLRTKHPKMVRIHYHQHTITSKIPNGLSERDKKVFRAQLDYEGDAARHIIFTPEKILSFGSHNPLVQLVDPENAVEYHKIYQQEFQNYLQEEYTRALNKSL